jgi:hypothetical protein
LTYAILFLFCLIACYTGYYEIIGFYLDLPIKSFPLFRLNTGAGRGLFELIGF